mmetsp:Transcript_108294/g.337474  ORF Transcript_108294/g.337474 Transcript_108294/m.337474 type:complete len:336 (+) Transcript_108294:829-1836(+)
MREGLRRVPRRGASPRDHHHLVHQVPRAEQRPEPHDRGLRHRRAGCLGHHPAVLGPVLARHMEGRRRQRQGAGGARLPPRAARALHGELRLRGPVQLHAVLVPASGLPDGPPDRRQRLPALGLLLQHRGLPRDCHLHAAAGGLAQPSAREDARGKPHPRHQVRHGHAHRGRVRARGRAPGADAPGRQHPRGDLQLRPARHPHVEHLRGLDDGALLPHGHRRDLLSAHLAALCLRQESLVHAHPGHGDILLHPGRLLRHLRGVGGVNEQIHHQRPQRRAPGVRLLCEHHHWRRLLPLLHGRLAGGALRRPSSPSTRARRARAHVHVPAQLGAGDPR